LAIQTKLQIEKRSRDLALFNLAKYLGIEVDDALSIAEQVDL
jgi:hypothetical protein